MKPLRKYLGTALLVGFFALAAGTAYYAGRKSAVQEERSNVDSDRTTALPDISEPAHEPPHEELSVKLADDAPALIDRQIPTAETGSTGLIEKVGQVKRMLVLYPELELPEFKLLTDEDWLKVANNMNEDSDIEAMEAISILRQRAAQKFIPQIKAAREEYQKEHGGRDASDPALLAKYITDPDLKQVLSRYTISNDPKWIYVDMPPRNCWFCALTAIGRDGSVGVSRDDGPAVNRAIERFRTENGRSPTTSEELEEYLVYPTPIGSVERYLEEYSKGGSNKQSFQMPPSPLTEGGRQ